MRALPSPVADEPAFEIKGTVSSLTVLRLRCVDLARLEADLAARIAPHPQIFLHAPVVFDAAQLEDKEVPWAELARLARAVRLVPVAVAGPRPEEMAPAVAAGLGVIQLGPRLRTVEPDESLSTPPVPEAPPPPAAEAPAPPRPPLQVTAPVRGGQVVYARGGDLVVVSSVNPGAQVIADGSVQVWGPLRGRALAGAQGRRDVRILCLALEAELVSVAGEYVMAEEIPAQLRGKPAQVYLEGEHVKIVGL